MEPVRKSSKSQLSIFKSIFFSYLLMCIVLIVVTIITYINYNYTLTNTIKEYATQQANIISLQAERRYIQIQNVLEALSNSDRLLSYSQYSEDEFSTKVSELLSLRSDFTNNILTTECSDLYAYFYNSQSIMSTNSRNYNKKMTFLFHNSKGITEEEFNNIIDFQGIFNIHIFPSGQIWMMRSFYDKSLQRTGVLIAETRSEYIIKYIDQTYQDNLLIFSIDGCAFYNSEALSEEKLAQITSTEMRIFETKILDRHYLVAREPLQSMKWELFVGIPEDNLYDGLHVFKLIFLFEFVGTVILAVILAVTFSRKTYAPVKQLIEILNHNKDSRFQETYDSLTADLKTLVEQNKILSRNDKIRQFHESNDTMRRIFNGSITNASIIQPLMEQLAHIQPEDSFFLSLVYLPDKSWGMADDIDLKYFILENVLNELLFQQFNGYLFHYNDNCFIVAVKSSGENDEAIITEKLQAFIDFLKSAFKIYPYITLSGLIFGFDNLADIYFSLEEEMRYHSFWLDESSLGKVWHVGSNPEIDEKTDFREYLEISRKLINYLEIGDYKEADNTLEYMFINTFPKSRKYLKYNIYRMYGLISTISIILDIQTDKRDQEFLMSLNYEERLYGAKNFNDFRLVSRELFASIISYNIGKEADGMPTWMQDVLIYLQQNYSNINLSVSSLADTFQISVPHLSRTFKTYMDSGVLEYIHKLRIGKAKELLSQGINVQEAAELSGYLDAKALRRDFKRYEGINPGQYRNLQKERPQ